ncbi:hypothetical protein CHO01_31730 [Cellulomonas hominis]|uniref:Uncharacterized protein n=1 Tax=Cellulomonas hominis TaxID=156981 RepID=A0A511FI75_9CELL|nr:hypothetical protein [Cellulomonas hominis]MBB5474833.1 hypothetical protein [Cellulomonas hominis]NKY05641.1 hypothetical protein [Cellulomonas hominis]GEL48057.1 hypothetical protein CHO01_31730 [Cellulomonas hominis]
MTWDASDVIAAIAIVASAAVAITTVRMQQRAVMTGRRRESHLRAWQAANHALRTQQARLAALQQPGLDPDRSEDAEIAVTMDAYRDACVELEIVSPRIAEGCLKALSALELSREDLRELAGVRHEMLSEGPTGGALKRSLTVARSDLDAARTDINAVQRMMHRYEPAEKRRPWRWGSPWRT